MDIIKKGFGEQLKTLRKLKGYTQESLAESIGINLRQLARIEAGESFISSDTLYKICQTLQITPKNLFDFDIQEEILMTGTHSKVHFNVIKEDNIFRLVLTENNTSNSITEYDKEQTFDERMIQLAQRLQKEIFVNEIQDGIEISSKIYTPQGKIKSTKNSSTNDFDELKNKLAGIVNDKKKIEYMNLAFESLHSKEALNELKTLIKGIELLL